MVKFTSKHPGAGYLSWRDFIKGLELPRERFYSLRKPRGLSDTAATLRMQKVYNITPVEETGTDELGDKFTSFEMSPIIIILLTTTSKEGVARLKDFVTSGVMVW
jgi:hypothetical protein